MIVDFLTLFTTLCKTSSNFEPFNLRLIPHSTGHRLIDIPKQNQKTPKKLLIAPIFRSPSFSELFVFQLNSFDFVDFNIVIWIYCSTEPIYLWSELLSSTGSTRSIPEFVNDSLRELFNARRLVATKTECPYEKRKLIFQRLFSLKANGGANRR